MGDSFSCHQFFRGAFLELEFWLLL